MMNQFTIDYTTIPQNGTGILTYRAVDPVEAEDFLMHLLAAGAHIKEIRNKGEIVPDKQFTKMLKAAAEKSASVMLSESLALDPAQVKHRFGFSS